MPEQNAPVNTKYHSGFVNGLKVILWENRFLLDLEEEKWLSKEGLRIDVLIKKKDAAAKIDLDICRIFRKYNIVEYKQPDDNLNMNTFAKVMAYAHLYKAMGASRKHIRYDEITATIYRHTYPRNVFKQLERYGAIIEEKNPGVYCVQHMAPFSVQILVGRQLDPEKYAMFRVQTPDASDEDILRFRQMALQHEDDAEYQKSIDGIFQVSISLNREKYDRLLQEDPAMCEAMKDLMKDIIAEEVEKKVQEKLKYEREAAEGRLRQEREAAETSGEIKGTVKTYKRMGVVLPEIITRIMADFGLKREVAEKYVKDSLGLQMA